MKHRNNSMIFHKAGAMSFSAKAFVLTLLLMVVAGCANSNVVRLNYALGSAHAPCTGDVVVFKFQDKRATGILGKNTDGRTLTTQTDVADWVGWAVFEEVQAAGIKTRYRTTDMSLGDGTVLTGEVLEVALNQTGHTTYAGRIAIRVILKQGGTVVHQEKLVSEVEDVVLPSYATQSDIMAETLRGVTAEVVSMVCEWL